MVPATQADVADIIELRDGLAQWMLDQGIDQWRPGEYPTEVAAAQVHAGEWFVHRVDGALVATVRIAYSDTDFWGDDIADAGYIHGLMVAPSHRRGGMGREVVTFAEKTIRAAGKSLARLDTATGNPVLMAYYPHLGFRPVREAKLPAQFGRDMSITLFEKDVASP